MTVDCFRRHICHQLTKHTICIVFSVHKQFEKSRFSFNTGSLVWFKSACDTWKFDWSAPGLFFDFKTSNEYYNLESRVIVTTCGRDISNNPPESRKGSSNLEISYEAAPLTITASIHPIEKLIGLISIITCTQTDGGFSIFSRKTRCSANSLNLRYYCLKKKLIRNWMIVFWMFVIE